MPGVGVFGAVGFGGTEQGGEMVAVVPVEGACFVATGGADVGGTVAAARGGGEGELAYGEHAAADSCYGQVHHPVLIVEDTQGGGFLGEPAGVGFTVAVLNAHKHHHAAADRAYCAAVYLDRGPCNTLYHYSHFFVTYFVSLV